MKNAIAILMSGWLLVCGGLAPTAAFAGDDDHAYVKPGGQLVNQIRYEFVGHLGQLDKKGRLLVWQGEIDGDISGQIRWWFEIPSEVPDAAIMDGRIAFYQSRWEILQDDKVILAGKSAGKTVFLFGGDGVWDGHGVVTKARGKYSRLKGRKVSETGPVILGSTPPLTFAGTGMFHVY